MDRGYEGYNLMAHFQEKEQLFLIRIRDGNKSIKEGFDLPQAPCFDLPFQLKLCRKQTNEMKRLYREFPNDYHFLAHTHTFDFLETSLRKHQPIQWYELKFRMVRLEISPGQYETLLTNTDYSIEELKNLYASRWGIETSFRDLKYSVGLVNFHAKKKEGLLQEIYARFINFNFTKWVTSQIVIQKARKKGAYKICFSDAAYACRLFWNGVLTSSYLETYLARHLSIIRPNRKYRRRIRAQTVVSFIYRVP